MFNRWLQPGHPLSEFRFGINREINRDTHFLFIRRRVNRAAKLGRLNWDTHYSTAQFMSVPATSPLCDSEPLSRRLRHLVGKAIADYAMIADGDRVMVCLSGGKDSYGLLDILLQLQARAPVRFELHAVHLDQHQPGYDPRVLPAYLDRVGVAYTILSQDTYSVVQRVVPTGKSFCGLCSRLRRGALYAFAERSGFNRIALGHHREDLAETLFLNLFHHAKLAAMPPKLRSDDGKHIVIRPLAYCAESDLQRYAELRGFPIMPCNLCGSQENLQRRRIKAMLAEWEAETPGRTDNIVRALADVRPSQLADRRLFDFAGLCGSNASTSSEASPQQPPAAGWPAP